MDIKKTLIAVAAATGISVGVLQGTADLVKPQEGLALRAYRDPANPSIATICYGETQGVTFGDRHTAEECEAMLIKRLPDYISPIRKMLPELPDNRLIAYGDAAWNMGVGIITRQDCAKRDKTTRECLQYIPDTSIYDHEKAGQWPQACARLKLFVSANGKRLPGLVKRREAEYRVCMGAGKTS